MALLQGGLPVRSFVHILLAITAEAAFGDTHRCTVLDVKVSAGTSVTVDRIGLSSGDFQRHFIDGDFNFEDPAKSSWSCFDGRNTQGVFGTPGGDVGEFVVGLTVYDELTNHTLSKSDVSSLFGTFVAALPPGRRLYMHSDERALDKLRSLLKEQSVPNAEQLTLGDVPEQYRQMLLARVGEPDFIGCGHLRLLVANAVEYQVRRELVQWLIQESFVNLWNSNGQGAVQIEVMHGDHEEQVVIAVEVNVDNVPEHDECQLLAPLVRPMVNGQPAFVYHPTLAEKTIRTSMAAFFVQQPASQGLGLTATAYLAKSNALASLHLRNTLRHMADGRSVYNVTVVVGASGADDTHRGSQHSPSLAVPIVVGVVITFVGVALAVGTKQYARELLLKTRLRWTLFNSDDDDDLNELMYDEPSPSSAKAGSWSDLHANVERLWAFQHPDYKRDRATAAAFASPDAVRIASVRFV